MTGNAEELEMKERLNLIETMIAEGRRTTESWGWTFVLWGVAYYVALAWSMLGQGNWADWAWPVTMIAGVALTVAIAMRKGRTQPTTKIGRAIASVWNAMGISMMLLSSCSEPQRPDRLPQLHRHGGGDAGPDQCGLQYDSQVEGAVCLCRGLVGGLGGGVFWP